MVDTDTTPTEVGRDFIRDIVQADLDAGRVKRVITRFPPEPNGFLHLGHAKSICLNFGIAREFGGECTCGSTTPTRSRKNNSSSTPSSATFAGSVSTGACILYHASDYFEQLYEWAEHLIRTGKAYVDDTRPEQMRSQRGTLTEPGQNSPFRYRSVEENLDLFRRMRAGEFPNGARVLRAKIDMASGNMNLRDPVLYRILPRHPSAHRRCLVHLPDLRFRPRPVRCDRAHHSQRLHPGVRGSPPAVRLADRQPARSPRVRTST